MPVTYATTDMLESLTGYIPTTSIDIGIGRFVEWYRDYYRA